MTKMSPKASIFGASVLVLLLLGVSSAAPANQQQPNPWIQRRLDFYRNTTFELSQDNIRLLGGKFSQIHSAHLPFWFDFELFKNVFKKSYADAGEELARHRIYINTCIQTLKARVMYRILASNEDAVITSQADRVSVTQLPAPKARPHVDAAASWPAGWPH